MNMDDYLLNEHSIRVSHLCNIAHSDHVFFTWLHNSLS